MRKLADLQPLFGDDKLDANVNHEQLKVFHDIFVEDFITSPFKLNGKKIRIDPKPPRPKEFKPYSESFFHIVTRRINFYNDRFYECNRANRIHWIKPILLSHPCNDIKYYKWLDDDGICKEHFFYLSKRFMVVLKPISDDVQIVTAFCVDEDQVLKYFERFRDYEDGKGTC